MPARSNSLFFAGRPALAARSLSACSTAYSVLGMLKLSRTSLGLRAFGSFAFAAFAALAGLATFAAWAGAAALRALAGAAAGFTALACAPLVARAPVALR